MLSLLLSASGLVVESEQAIRFQQYTTQFNKTYDNVEFASRLQVFLKAEQSIEELNAARTSDEDAEFGWTKFSDWTAEEFSKLRGYKRDEFLERDGIPFLTESGTLKSVDWRDSGKVTAVKDQAQCGSCWAFSAVETVESAALMAGTLGKTILSEQQVVSCDTSDDGCNGGDLVTAFQYMKKAGGLDSESEYPYKSGGGKTGKCKDPKEYIKQTKPTKWAYGTKPCNYGRCKKQDETALGTSLATVGPLGICVNAGSDSWQNYKKGVMTPSQCGSSSATSMDHCVQLVGMSVGNANGKDYWIVRNSWNTDWGLDGYIHFEMGKNTCGVANEAMYVTLD